MHPSNPQCIHTHPCMNENVGSWRKSISKVSIWMSEYMDHWNMLLEIAFCEWLNPDNEENGKKTVSDSNWTFFKYLPKVFDFVICSQSQLYRPKHLGFYYYRWKSIFLQAIIAYQQAHIQYKYCFWCDKNGRHVLELVSAPWDLKFGPFFFFEKIL